MSERVVVHIGVHKTGTTSIQDWADTHRDELLSRFGFEVYYGRLGGGKNHIEFPLMSMRSDRNLHARVMHPDSCLPSWRSKTEAHIAAKLATQAPTTFISAEGLSYLRRPDELATLRELLGPRDIQIIAMLRDPDDYLRSYRSQMRALGYRPSEYPESFNYVEPDTWVVKFDELIAAYTGAFGDDHVTVLSYEEAMATYGSVVPAVARAAGLPVDRIPAWDGIWLNAAGQPASLVTRARRALRDPGGALRRRFGRRHAKGENAPG